jgi:hypothetical protein
VLEDSDSIGEQKVQEDLQVARLAYVLLDCATLLRQVPKLFNISLKSLRFDVALQNAELSQ